MRVGVLLGMLLALAAACSSGGGSDDADVVADVVAESDGTAEAEVDATPEAEAEAVEDADAAPEGDVEDVEPDVAPEADVDDGDDDAGDDGGDDGGTINPCVEAGGICTGSGMCATTEIPAGAPGCIFDDGPGVCCDPPDPEPTGDTCDSYGGICATVGACLRSEGWFTPADCHMGASVVCCVPRNVCGDHDRICCTPGPGADFMPQCDRSGLTCDPFEGTTLRPIDDCPE